MPVGVTYNAAIHSLRGGTMPLVRCREGKVMAEYLLVESRDPFEYADAAYFYHLAADLCRAGNTVTFFLVQNGVIVARKGVEQSPVAALRQAAPDVTILADDFSLRERAIAPDRLADGVAPSDVDALVERLAVPGVKAIWH